MTRLVRWYRVSAGACDSGEVKLRPDIASSVCALNQRGLFAVSAGNVSNPVGNEGSVVFLSIVF